MSGRLRRLPSGRALNLGATGPRDGCGFPATASRVRRCVRAPRAVPRRLGGRDRHARRQHGARDALRGAHRAVEETAPERPALGRSAALRQGLTSNLLNPKIAVFFTSLLPQFVDAHTATAADLLLLGVLFNAMGVIWLLPYAALAARGRAVLTRPLVRRAIDRVSGVVLIALGVRIAFERR